MPLSPGCFEIWTNNDLRAEESVRGVDGIGGPDNVGRFVEPVSEVPRESVTENLRSGFFRGMAVGCGNCAVWGAWAIEDSEGADGSGSCKTSSRNGLQKYSAWSTEFA